MADYVRDTFIFDTLQLKAALWPDTAPNQIGVEHLGTKSLPKQRVLVAIEGDDDRLFEAGETGWLLAAAGGNNRLSNSASLNELSDPFTISAHGRIKANAVGGLSVDKALGFNRDWGFGVDNGPDRNNRWLNDGDSITWTLNPIAGNVARYATMSFVADLGGAAGSAALALDIDGDVIRSGTYKAAANASHVDALLRLSVKDGAKVGIDLDAGTLTINGVLKTGAAVSAFLEAFKASDGDSLTIGALGGRGFSVRDLTIGRSIESVSGEGAPDTVEGASETIDHPEKIGIGTWQATASSLDGVNKLGAAWYYTWDTWGLAGASEAEFVPMVWGGGSGRLNSANLSRAAAASSDVLLVFNEPDRADQSNMTVAQALDGWSQLEATGKRLGSPAVTADQALGDSSWLHRFLEGAAQRGYDIDFINVHYYATSPDIAAFERFLTSLHDEYGLPVWVTEWALVGLDTWSTNQAQFSQA